MKPKVKLLLSLFGAAAVILPVYIFFHEFGHLIVMLSAGAVIDGFSIFGAHVSAHGGNYTNISDLWLHANGAVLPAVLSWVWMLLYRSRAEKVFYRVFSFFVALVPASSLLAWVIIPIVSLNGQAPAGDDCTKFLFNFSQGHSPLLVSAAALLLIAVSAALALRKGIVRNFRGEIFRGR